jgi:hypothetical protein
MMTGSRGKIGDHSLTEISVKLGITGQLLPSKVLKLVSKANVSDNEKFSAVVRRRLQSLG